MRTSCALASLLLLCVGRLTSAQAPGHRGTRRTIVWNISADYDAIAFIFPPASSQPWQLQLPFNSLSDTRLSKASQDIWRVHGCTLLVPKERDRKEGGFTHFIP
jgi:hypothetical protein